MGIELAALVIFIYFLVFFVVATIIKNNSIVDIGWGLGFVVTAWILFFVKADYGIDKIIVNVLVSLWGLRLFLLVWECFGLMLLQGLIVVSVGY